MAYNIISADGHIDLRVMPGDAFTSRASSQWVDRVPKIVETEHGPRWFADGIDLVTLPQSSQANMTLPKRGVSKHIDRMYEAGFYEGGSHPVTPELRLKDQEIDGVDAEVIYGIFAVHRLIKDRELLKVIYQLYNDFAADLAKSNPSRFITLGCIPNDDPHAAAAEVRRAASIGLKGVDFGVATASVPIWHRDWDPLWEAIQECEIPISFHTSGVPVRRADNDEMAEEYRDQVLATTLTMFQLVGGEFLSAIIFSGALERYPRMKFILGECGVGWLPYVLSRMDEEYEDRFTHLELSMKPSEYWRRQGYTTFQHEPNIADLIHLVGVDNVMWGSDYPHPDGVWPDSLAVIEQDLGRLPEEDRRKITRDNAGKLYGLL